MIDSERDEEEEDYRQVKRKLPFHVLGGVLHNIAETRCGSLSNFPTKIDNDVKKVLASLGVRNAMNPEKLSFQSKNKSDKEQLVVDLGFEYMNQI